VCVLSGRISIAGLRPLRVGCVGPLFKFIARKRPSEFRFPDAVSRQCVLPTPSGLSELARCMTGFRTTGDRDTRMARFELPLQ
jgi:hypothetical protein